MHLHNSEWRCPVLATQLLVTGNINIFNFAIEHCLHQIIFVMKYFLNTITVCKLILEEKVYSLMLTTLHNIIRCQTIDQWAFRSKPRNHQTSPQGSNIVMCSETHQLIVVLHIFCYKNSILFFSVGQRYYLI